MAAVFAPPMLSAFDPRFEAEGSIDPLGLATVYERLADLILPGVTVRMRRPRFLTALAVGAYVCGDYSQDEVASDGDTPPYLAFEWWVIEAFERTRDRLSGVGGIPGFQKVTTARRDGRPVSSASYLKTASVFGFTGIFRRLARQAQIIGDSGFLDENGIRLVKTWAHEQGLDGFYNGATGNGASFRSELRKAVRDALRDAHTSHRTGAFWQSITRYLDPGHPGLRERAVLLDLINTRAGQPEEVQYLTRALVQHGQPIDVRDEAEFLRVLTNGAPERLRTILLAIDAYEAFCRPLVDAFDWIRFLASSNPSRGVTRSEFTKEAPAGTLSLNLKSAIDALVSHEVFTTVWPDRADPLALLRDSASADSLFDRVLQHHRNAQERKPPDGKRAWVEDAGRGRVLIRAAYTLEQPPADASPYVHEFRMPTVSRFLEDLGAYR